ncbi:MAG: hypothetical protein NTW05_07345, partial [Pseudonocardiales bacterium]|nr:hypothetical protein [Pseudonocardiales bacterium]
MIAGEREDGGGMAAALTEHDVAAVRGEVAAGRPVTVWFTPAAVGVPVGGSAKVVTVDDVAEGEFIQVRRTGSRDTMFCSPAELTRTRPPRRRAGDPEPAAGTAPAQRIVAKRTAGKPSAQPVAAQPAAGRSAAATPAAARPAAAKAAAEKAADRPAAGRPADDPT